MSTKVGQLLLTLLENDALVAFGPPLVTFLTAVQTASGDPLKLTAAWVQLQGDVVGHAPGALGALEGQVAATIAAKIRALIPTAPAAAPAKA